MARDFDAVSLDVGGVLVVPDHGVLAQVLDDHGIAYDRSAFGAGHYIAMAAMDRAMSDAEDFTDYLRGFVDAVGVPLEAQPLAHDELTVVLRTPVWCQPVLGARLGVAALAAAGVRLAVTSNSDGRVADVLRRHEWLQVGEGPGVQAEVVTDSGDVGYAKPDARMFQVTADALDLAPDRVLHVGDSVYYDVEGAAAAGMQAVHMDPFGLCRSTEHRHVAALVELLD
jgi:FMN phosphatase YigB (HAD superfamily)